MVVIGTEVVNVVSRRSRLNVLKREGIRWSGAADSNEEQEK